MLDLNDVVADIDRMLARLIGEDVTLVTALEPDLGNVRADPGQIEQVLVNLAVNARDAMPEGGTLDDRDRRTSTLDEDSPAAHPDARPGATSCSRSTDTGVGMTPRRATRIFEPFFTTKETGKGTGLGLATVYGIVRRAAGTSRWTASRATARRSGSTCRASGARPRRPGRTAGAAPAPNGTETILLVEDEAGVRRCRRTVLEQQGTRS